MTEIYNEENIYIEDGIILSDVFDIALAQIPGGE